PRRDRGRACRDVSGRVRWLRATARHEYVDVVDVIDDIDDERIRPDSRIRPDPLHQACVVWYEECPWLRANRRGGPVRRRLGLEPPRRGVTAPWRSPGP